MYHGDGITYEGECECHGVKVRGTIAKGRPRPYRVSDLWTGESATVILLMTDTGAHDVRVTAAQPVEEA